MFSSFVLHILGLFPVLRAVSMATGGCKMWLPCDRRVWGSPPVILTSVLPQSNEPHPHPPHKQRTGLCSHPAFMHDIMFISLPEKPHKKATPCFIAIKLPSQFCCSTFFSIVPNMTWGPYKDFFFVILFLRSLQSWKINMFTHCAKQACLRQTLLGRNMCSCFYTSLKKYSALDL